MFNPLRLFRRAEHIDETADAYVEGRATERDMAELQARAESDPGLLDDLDSIRSTVALLRSVEPAKAPRSFALAEAPVQVRVRRSRMAMAPAVFAIAAAAAVGLLAVGNLTDVVRQSDSTSEDSNRTALQASDESCSSRTALKKSPRIVSSSQNSSPTSRSDNATCTTF